METKSQAYALRTVINKIKKRTISLDHKMQRITGQWNNSQKSLLIDSILRDYLIPPLLIWKKSDENVEYVIDGIQRLSTILSFINNDFPLSAKLEPIIVNGETIEIAKKRFSKLPQEFKDKIDEVQINTIMMLDATYEDVQRMFSRWNNSKPLNAAQKRTGIEDEKLLDIINRLASHEFIINITTKAQKKAAFDKDIVRQVLLLSEADKGYEFNGFGGSDINKFVEYYNENIDSDAIENLEKTFDYMKDVYTELPVNRVSIVPIVYTYFCALQQNKDLKKLDEKIKKFIETYEQNEEYSAFCNTGGTAKKEMVEGRINYFKKLLKSIK